MENLQAKQWVPGQNHPLIFRGHKGEICDKARIIVGNLLWHFKDEAMRKDICAHLLASGNDGGMCGQASHEAKALSNYRLVAVLTGLCLITGYRVEQSFESMLWEWERKPSVQTQPDSRHMAEMPRPLNNLPALVRANCLPHVSQTDAGASHEEDIDVFLAGHEKSH